MAAGFEPVDSAALVEDRPVPARPRPEPGWVKSDAAPVPLISAPESCDAEDARKLEDRLSEVLPGFSSEAFTDLRLLPSSSPHPPLVPSGERERLSSLSERSLQIVPPGVELLTLPELRQNPDVG